MQFAKSLAGSRLFAFLAVSCSIAAVAWASREPLLLAIGIPGLAAGHFYSWRKRDAVSTRRTLLLFLFMVFLTVYMSNDILLYGATDRLLLSRYLIYGLVISSFDLLRRRNVVASLILGVLLLILISELALSLWFLVFIAVFTILAVIASAIGRVEIVLIQSVLVGELKWISSGKVWLSFAAGTFLLSTILFLLIPRLAISNVAQAAWLPSRLDLSLGGLTTLPSKPSTSVSPGIFPSRQDGEIIGSGQYATLGYAGSLADRPVMHVRSRISSYWRGATLDKYDGQGWLSSPPDIKLQDGIRREFTLPDSAAELSGKRIYWQVYYMLSDQPNAIFTGYNPGRIYLPQITLLEQGSLYRALSLVPYLKPDLLRKDSAALGDIRNLALPPITERTATLAESIVQGAPTDYDKAARLEHFLLTNYPYDLNVEALPAGRDAADYFLFEQQTGYCSHFATTMAVMARHVGLPSRVAVGYLPGFIDPMTGAHVVRVGDAHAWVEVHFQQHGWVAFDPTPRADAAMGFAAGRNWLYFGLEDFTGVTFARMLSPLARDFSFGMFSVPAWGWISMLSGVIVAIVLVMLLSRRKVRGGQELRGYSILDGESRRTMLKLYRKMVAVLAEKGLPYRLPYQPLSEYAGIVCPQVPGSRETIEWLTKAASKAAYDSKPFSSSIIPEAKWRLSILKRARTHR